MDNLFPTINKIISSPYWVLALYVILFCAVVLWLVLVFWTYKDARKRIDDPVIVGVAVLTLARPPLHGHLGLRHPAARRVPCRGPRAGAGDAGHGAGTPHPAGLPFVRGGHPARLSGLSQLPAASAHRLSVVRQGARAGLEALPLLRARPQGTAGPPARRRTARSSSKCSRQPPFEPRGRRALAPGGTGGTYVGAGEAERGSRGLVGEVIGRLERRGLTSRAPACSW